MIITVTMKDTDVLYDAINEAIEEQLKASGLDQEEQDAIKEIRQEKVGEVASLWWEYGEYLTVQFDTENKTIRVVSVEELEKNR